MAVGLTMPQYLIISISNPRAQYIFPAYTTVLPSILYFISVGVISVSTAFSILSPFLSPYQWQKTANLSQIFFLYYSNDNEIYIPLAVK